MMQPQRDQTANEYWLSPEFFADPYPCFDALRTTDPVHWNEVLKNWVFTRYDHVVAVLRNTRVFSNQGRMAALLDELPETERHNFKPLYNHFSVGLIHADPPDHTRLRRLLNKVFTAEVIERLRPRVETLVARDGGFVSDSCFVRRKGKRVELHAPTFTFRLDTRRGLRAIAWENKLTGKTLTLGSGLEFDCDLDAAERRISITGWKGIASRPGRAGAGFFRPEFDDSKWDGMNSPACQWSDKGPMDYWARTHVFLPEGCQDKRLALVLGGFGLFDFRFMRVFVNGHAMGVRHARRRWNEPKAFALGPASKAHRYLRFGQENVIALQLTGYITRTKRLDECDPHHGRNLPLNIQWPAQFEQYLVVGQPLAETVWRVARWSVERPGVVAFHLAEDEHQLAACVTYRWKVGEPTLHKFVEVTNRSQHLPLVMAGVADHCARIRPDLRLDAARHRDADTRRGDSLAELFHPQRSRVSREIQL